MKKKIFVFGASGTLGTNLIYFLQKKYDFIFNVHKSKFFYDNVSYCNYFKDKKTITEKNLFEKLNIIKPDILINCAANTNLDYCEKNSNKTKFVNQILPGLLSNVCRKLTIKFVHISTDHLYSGLDSIKKTENFATNPINIYGRQKKISENKVLKNNKNSIIIRTNFFGYSPNKNQFLDSMIECAKQNKKLTLYTDYLFTPISTKYLSNLIFLLLKKDFKGIVNAVSGESISKHDFGVKVFKALNLDKNLIIKSKMKNISSAKRCKNLSLSNTKLKKIINLQVPSLSFQLKNFFKEKDLIEKKIFSKIPYGKHSINNSDIRSVTSVLKSGSLTQGNYILETEKKIANYVGSKYAVLVSSATAGLHITYKALNLSNTNSLITSPITFVSTANAAFYCNSKVLFNDIDEDTISLSTSILKQKLIQNKKRVQIIAPVHMGGLAANMMEIHKIAKEHKIKVVEDAAHAIGALYECGSKVGCCKYSDAAVFSFHPVKIIASGEGGVVTTNDYKLYLKLISLRTHGITNKSIVNKKFGYSKGIPNLWYYEMQDLGYHYRQTEIHAALLNSQLDRIDTFLNKRKKLAKRYDQAFYDNKYIQLPQKNYRNISSNHLYILKVNFKKLRISRNDFMKKLREYNIITQVHYIPLPIHPFYNKKKYDINKYKKSLNYYNDCLSIPIYYDLSNDQQDYVISAILELTQ